MVRLQSFELMLEEAPGEGYHSGDLVRGTVHLELAQSLDVKEVKVKCVGMCRVTWAHAAMDTQLADVTTDEEYYINSHIVLYKSGQPCSCGQDEESRRSWQWTRWLPNMGTALSHSSLPSVRFEDRLECPQGCTQLSTSERMPAGEHNFQFEFRLPAGAPGSLASPSCNIRYWVKAIVRHGRHSDTNTRHLTVNPRLDLNMFPSARESVELTAQVQVTSLFSAGTGVEATVRLEKTGFLSGEVIHVKYIIRNNTNRAIHSAVLELKRVQYCTVWHDLATRTQQTVVARAKLRRVGERSTVEEEETSLRVPRGYLSLPSGCNLMKISYVLMLKIRPCLLSSKKLKISKEITVGNVPFQLSVGDLRPTLHSCWCFLPPPTYEEVMAKENGENEATGAMKSPAPPALTKPTRRMNAKAGNILVGKVICPSTDSDTQDPESTAQLPSYKEAMVLLSRCTPEVQGKSTLATPCARASDVESNIFPPAHSWIDCAAQGRELQSIQEDGVVSPTWISVRRSSQTIRCGQ